MAFQQDKRRKVEMLPPQQRTNLAMGGIPMVVKAKPSTTPAPAAGDEKKEKVEEEQRLPSERELGMTAYLDKTRPGFVAIFKQRFGDFIVREVDESGNVVRLTDLETLPQYDLDEDARSNRVIAESETTAVFEQLLGDEAAAFLTYARLPEGDKARNERYTLKGNFADKELRTKVHLAIKEHFKLLFAETKQLPETNEHALSISYSTKRHRSHMSDWPKDKPDYVKFVLYKENKDTSNVIDLLCKLLRVTPKLFGTAGLKDKRAVTTQHVTAYRIPAQRLRDLNPKLFSIRLGNFTYVKNSLKLGSLKGNHFTITLRNIVAPIEVLEDAAAKVKKHGFINYFGTQRFGTGTINTHDIGRMLLQSKWSEAIDLLLKPRPFEEQASTEARTYFQQTGDIYGTLNKMPRKHVIERNLLVAMKRHGKNLNAISELPYNTRLLYVHAYQSYIFNLAASRRIETVDHLNPIVGDIICNEKGDYDFITAETLSRYSLDDVYLPLPGFDNKYPNNEIGVWIKEFMRKDGINPDDMRRGQKVFSLPGGYRKLIMRPVKFDYRIVHYSDYTIPLAPTDLETLEKKELPAAATEGNLLGVVIEMILESSTYATMLIRELTKNETGMLYQRHIQSTVVDKQKKEGASAGPQEDGAGGDDEDAFIESGAYGTGEEFAEEDPDDNMDADAGDS